MKTWKVVTINLISVAVGVIAGAIIGTVASDKIKEGIDRVCKKANGDEATFAD